MNPQSHDARPGRVVLEHGLPTMVMVAHQPLPEERLLRMVRELGKELTLYEFAREVERAHGIK